MVEVNLQTRRAFANALGSIRAGSRLPNRVLGAEWNHVLFFEADILAQGPFVFVVHALCKSEKSEIACMINLSRGGVNDIDSAEFFSITLSTSPRDYVSRLKQGGPASGWLYHMETFSCSSELGEWIIYCERNNEVGLIAFRSSSSANKYGAGLELLDAHSLHSLMNDENIMKSPFDQLVPEWKNLLEWNYQNDDRT